MARVWDSEVLNCPHVNQPINAEQSRITSALPIISPFACEDMGRIWERLLQDRGMLYFHCLGHEERDGVVEQKEDEAFNGEKHEKV